MGLLDFDPVDLHGSLKSELCAGLEPGFAHNPERLEFALERTGFVSRSKSIESGITFVFRQIGDE
jgi:hypothetical protein